MDCPDDGGRVKRLMIVRAEMVWRLDPQRDGESLTARMK